MPRSTPEEKFEARLQEFAEALASSFASPVAAHPEDQLKTPVQNLLERLGPILGLEISSRTETPVEGLGARPDLGVTRDGLLVGHIELKAPGKGARPYRFKGADQQQWKKFQALPNLLYTDGQEWSMYRTGEAIGTVTPFEEDVIGEGAAAVTSAVAEELLDRFRNFVLWDPVVPDSPRALAEMLAPLCHVVREDVLLALEDEESDVSQLAKEWRRTLFPDADDAQFADAYAQTLTYALLLARLQGETELRADRAAAALDSGHGLLADTLRILGNPATRDEIGLGVELLERVISAVDPAALTRGGRDPWLYFYEDFLSAYDPQLRKDRGVYYTPVEVIHCQTHLVSQILEEQFGKDLSFADDEVTLLDPGVGTGAYPLAAMQHGLDRVSDRYGEGDMGARATIMANNMHGFEILVGPYAVAHLRLTQQLLEAGGNLPEDGIHVYLTDTLESPYEEEGVQTTLALVHRKLAEEHERARKIKAEKRILVCMGNPPYDRQTIDPDDLATERKGGWVRFGNGDRPLLEDFLEPVREAGEGVHLKNIYNDYVYFWRWALWKVFESTRSSGVVSYISASSYLRGPGFAGMRQMMREIFDDLWIIDLEGDQLGARKTENVFNISTPVAIAIGVRYGTPQPESPARVLYTRIEGSRADKLRQLDEVEYFTDLEWRGCFEDWQEPLLPTDKGDYFSWPLLTDLFPWQHSGVQMKRTWPIGESPEVLRRRWRELLARTGSDRAKAFRESGFRTIEKEVQALDDSGRLSPIASLGASTPMPEPQRYGFRSLDRQWIIFDPRLGDRLRPDLWQVMSDEQVFLTSLLTTVLGSGPAATASAHVPDLHHFRGSYGGKDAIPLWRDSAAEKPNLTTGLLDALQGELGIDISAPDFFAYVYAVLGTLDYCERFSEELVIPGPRVPVTKSTEYFSKGAELGRQLICLHTYGERFCPSGRTMAHGRARCTRAVPSEPDRYPDEFDYDEADETLDVGEGCFAPVSREVWQFSVSGLQVVHSWLSYRMKSGAGRKSSPLDDVRPERWTAEFTEELLRLLWILESTIDLQPGLTRNLEQIIDGPVFTEDELPDPTEEERSPPVQDDVEIDLFST